RLQGGGVRRALVAIECANFAGDVADTQEVQHDFPTVDIDIADLDAALQKNHHAVARLAAPADGVTPGELFGVTAPDQGIERGIGQPTEKCVVSEKRTDAVDE